MNQRGELRGILVGFDGSSDSRAALRWALLEGQTSHRPVHLVHSYDELAAASQELAATGRTLLDEGLEQCRGRRNVRVTAELLARRGSSPGESLLAASEAADLLVVGCRGHRSPQGLLWGSVSEHLSRHAPCPVVTVRPAADEHARRVVLGLTVPEPTDGALVYAFDYAARRGVGLTAINVWHERGVSGAGAVYPIDPHVGFDAQRHLADLEDALEPWRARFPEVMVTTESIGGHAASVLRYASEHAALLVVGRREKSGISLLLGSISQSMLHHASCPVAVVGLTRADFPALTLVPQSGERPVP